MYAREGECDKAISDYDESIRLDPKFADACRARGLVYASMGEQDKAIADYTEAIRLDPNISAAYG